MIRTTIAIFIFGTLAVYGWIMLTSPAPQEWSRPTADAHIVMPNGEVLYIDIADDTAERQKGLGGREFMPENEGLLFIHEQTETPSYWMKDMQFPIDFIWLKDNQIVDITENAPTEDPPTTYYTPKTPINQVLEVNAGYVAKQGLKIGQILDIQR